MNKEEKEVVNMIKTGLEVSVEGQIIEHIHLSRKEAKALLNLIQKQDKIIDKMAEKINQALDKLENEPYVAYTFYGDILHESDEIINILKGE